MKKMRRRCRKPMIRHHSPPKTRTRSKEKKKVGILTRTRKISIASVACVTSIVALLVALNQLSPNLIIVDVRNPDARFPSEARFELKNNGFFPLMDLCPSWHQLRFNMGGLDLTVGNMYPSKDEKIRRLSSGETVYIHALPSTYTDQARNVKECSYILNISFHKRFLFFRGGAATKSWNVSLRNPDNAPSQWDIKPL